MEIKLVVQDDDAKLIEEYYGLKTEKMLEKMLAVIVNLLKEAALLSKAGVKLDMEKIDKLGKQVGRAIFQETKKESKME